MPDSDDHLHSINESIDRKDILSRLMKYCAYQERCLSDIDKKLAKYDLSHEVISEMKEKLIQEGFINENRYARAYVHGKFRNNHWGKVKIRYGLIEKKINEIDIEKALDDIDYSDYHSTILKLARQKEARTLAPDLFVLRKKIASYLISKGFEPDIVWDTLKDAIRG